MAKNSMSGHLGIEFTAFGDDWIEATMPVNEKTRQPMGLLHGGANVVLAEELGSIASFLCVEDITGKSVVGIELSSSHLRSARKGIVTGKVTPIKIGRKTHVWNIEIRDEMDKPINVTRLTTMVIKNET